ncbi:MAG: hypothetical protein J7604_19665 [Sporocytophaga sp.]|uniref:hypothetical protein n=1 Tax=Sporocytophaga sp. TaxID=2231183 RepID=UPI001B0FABB2|nr:hypothetical protein [Sporocytophaga sp.]MBO9702438.1 hypothetical protein [Sporocytophaga sp.]
MANCNFSIEFNEPIEGLIEKARTSITAKGGKFTGDTLSGNYAIQTILGAIEGNYKVITGAVVFEITEKPFFVPCSKIEEELRKYLNPSTPSIA